MTKTEAAVVREKSAPFVSEGDCAPQNFIPRLVNLHAEGRFPFDRSISTYPLDRGEVAVKASERGKVLKAVLLPQRSAG